MIDKKDLKIVSWLRRNSRENLTKLSRATGIPVSTIFDRIKSNSAGVVNRFTVLLDYSLLGFGARATLLVKAGSEKHLLRDHLAKCFNVNSLYRVNNGFDFIAEVVFRDLLEVEDFVGELELKFGVREWEVHYWIEELRREQFLSDPAIADVVHASWQRRSETALIDRKI